MDVMVLAKDFAEGLGFNNYPLGFPPPRMPAANEGLGWDPLLKI